MQKNIFLKYCSWLYVDAQVSCRNDFQFKRYTQKCILPQVVFLTLVSQFSKFVEWFKICDTLRNFLPFVQFKIREKHPWGSVLLVKLQAKAGNFTKSNFPPWLFFMLFKLCKWYQIARSVSGKFEYLRNGIWLFHETKKNWIVPQILHFQKLSFLVEATFKLFTTYIILLQTNELSFCKVVIRPIYSFIF